MNPRELARRIDHTVLKPEATAAQIDRLCDECLEHGFFSACVNPVWVRHCADRLAAAARSASAGDRSPIVCSVAGFPLGASLPKSKAFEAARAVEDGALEIDMVANLALLIAGDQAGATRDIAAVVEAVARLQREARVKVILETRALSDEQIRLGCRAAAAAGAAFVKTSTGFHPAGGATVEHVALMRRAVDEIAAGGGPRLEVKASGGIRDLTTALAMIEAGASRLGMSAGVEVVKGVAASGREY